MDENIVEAENQSQQSLDVDIDGLSDVQVGGEADNSQTSDVHTQNDDQSQDQFEIDERFKELSQKKVAIELLNQLMTRLMLATTSLLKILMKEDR